MAEQNERAFQKQPTVVLYSKLKSKKSKKPLRYTRNVGLGFKTPREVHLSLFFIVFFCKFCKPGNSHGVALNCVCIIFHLLVFKILQILVFIRMF